MRKDDLVGGDVEHRPQLGGGTGAGFGGEAVVDPYGVDAAVPELIAGEVVDRDVTPGRILDRELGDVGEVGPLPGWVMVMHHRRSAGTDLADAWAAGRLSGMVQRFSTTIRSASARAARSSARSGGLVAANSSPATVRSTGPSPATVTVSKPIDSTARCQCPVTTDTPSVRPSRNDTKAQTAMSSTMPDPESDTTIETITSAVGRLMDDAWVDHGYTAPNTEVYPWLWLWDSCFHALIWADLDRPDRAVAELGCVLELQDGAGFVPHMGYQLDPQVPVDLWGRAGSSSITQPPMYGHAVAELRRRGIDVPDELAERAHAGLRFLVRDRARDPESGLITVVTHGRPAATTRPVGITTARASASISTCGVDTRSICSRRSSSVRPAVHSPIRRSVPPP